MHDIQVHIGWLIGRISMIHNDRFTFDYFFTIVIQTFHFLGIRPIAVHIEEKDFPVDGLVMIGRRNGGGRCLHLLCHNIVVNITAIVKFRR